MKMGVEGCKNDVGQFSPQLKISLYKYYNFISLNTENTIKLTKIIITPYNDQLIFKEDKYLIGKSNQNDAEFEKLLFVRRDIKDISIPRNIKFIGSYSFSESKIEEIFIPHSVTIICKCAFSDCCNLRKVEIPTNSNLQTIEEHAFSESKIKEIFIPYSVTKICERAFSYCSKLRKVEIPMNSSLQTIDEHAFSCSNIEEIFIPRSVTIILSSKKSRNPNEFQLTNN